MIIVTYFRKNNILTINNEGVVSSMPFDTQEQAREWLDNNGHKSRGLNLFL